MAFFESTMGGTLGGSFRIRMNIDVLGQEAGNNRSLIQYSAYLDRTSTSGGRIFNGFQTFGSTNINGYVPGRGPFTYDSTGVGRVITLANNEQYWIGHDGNGDANPFFRVDYDGGNGPYLTSGWVQGNVGMPHINRFTNIIGFGVSQVTDVSFVIDTAVDATANFLQVSLEDGVGWRDVTGATFNNYSFKVGGPDGFLGVQLPSNTGYNLRVRVRRADSGLWTESGTISTATLPQANLVDTMGL